jgi:hypothetical protein
MDVSGEESDQELSIITPADIVTKPKTLTTADLLPEKSLWPYCMRRNTMICLCNGARKTELKEFLKIEQSPQMYLNNHRYASVIICEYIFHTAYEGKV